MAKSNLRRRVCKKLIESTETDIAKYDIKIRMGEMLEKEAKEKIEAAETELSELTAEGREVADVKQHVEQVKKAKEEAKRAKDNLEHVTVERLKDTMQRGVAREHERLLRQVLCEL